MLSLVCVLREDDAIVKGEAGCMWECSDVRACRDGESPVWAASQGGHTACVEALIRLQADVLKCNRLVPQCSWRFVVGGGLVAAMSLVSEF